MKGKNVKRDMALGSIAENKVMELLRTSSIKAEKQSKKKFSDYDIEASILNNDINIDFTIEVKYDIYSLRSGNIAMEVFNPKINMPSGLMITKSDLWAHVTDAVYIANTKHLRDWVQNTVPKRTILRGGDDNATLYLYDIDVIFQSPLFVCLDKLKEKELFLTILNKLGV